MTGQLSLLATRPVLEKHQPFLIPVRSVINRIVGDQGLELALAKALNICPDGVSFAINFKLDDAKANVDLSNDVPDFNVKLSHGNVVIDGVDDCVDVDEEGFTNHRPRSFAQLLQGFGATTTSNATLVLSHSSPPEKNQGNRKPQCHHNQPESFRIDLAPNTTPEHSPEH